MEPIRVAWGSGAGPTALSSFDAALADANCHDYNLVRLSSVIPRGATVERAGTLPDLGPTGEALPAVVSRATVRPGAEETAVAGLGWVQSESGRGLFYEDCGADDSAVREAIERGLERGVALREWEVDGRVEIAVERRGAAADTHATAVVIAAYGTTEALLDGSATQRG